MHKIHLGLRWLRAVAQCYNYNYNKTKLWNICLKAFIALKNKMELGLGWLRAVAQGHNYNKYKYSKMKLVINFQMNLNN